MLTSAKNVDAFSQGTKSTEFIRFVARQPIFDRSEKVFGYELLFRNGLEQTFQADSDQAARSTLDSSLLFGIDALCDGRRAFINCTREVLLKDLITLLPSNLTVVEVLESVEADDLVMAACQRLKESGYLIALDDFAPNDPREPLTDLADIIKRYGPWRCRMLAEKVETQEEFREAVKDGFLYFQGYFFRKPELMTAREIPANRLNYLSMLEMVSRSELDMKEIERIIKGEASVCYRLLRYLNSAVFAFHTEIHSVRHALGMLGEREIRRWVRLVATVGAGQERSAELVMTALVRARFCERLSTQVATGDSDLFLLGLLSLMDVIMEIPMSQVLESVPLDQESKAVLLGGASRLRPLYQLMLAQESGEWDKTAELASQLGLSESAVAEEYFQAVIWARGVNAP